MATRKENIDIEYDEPQQEATLGAAESNGPYESQDPADWVPPMTVRIYPCLLYTSDAAMPEIHLSIIPVIRED